MLSTKRTQTLLNLGSRDRVSGLTAQVVKRKLSIHDARRVITLGGTRDGIPGGMEPAGGGP